MNNKLSDLLTECIRDIEQGGLSIEDCLRRRPDRAQELRPHLQLWRRFDAFEKAEPARPARQRGQQQLLTALADVPGKRLGLIPSRLAPAATAAGGMLVAFVLLAGGVGASAALGGPDFADDVLSTIGIVSSAENTLETVDENTPDEAGFGLDTAQDAVENGGVDGLDIAGEQAADGLNTAGEAQQQSGNDAGIPDGVDLPDNVPNDVPVPDSVPAGPRP